MKRIMKLLSVLFVLMLAISCIQDRLVKVKELEVGDLVPDFTVEMNDGTIVTGDQLREGVSVIVFFYTGCPDCASTLPEVQKIYDEYLPCGVSFALISRGEEYATVSLYWRNHGMTMPFSAQSTREVYNLFATSRIPRVYVCKEGVITAIFTDNPNPTYEDIKSALDNL